MYNSYLNSIALLKRLKHAIYSLNVLINILPQKTQNTLSHSTYSQPEHRILVHRNFIANHKSQNTGTSGTTVQLTETLGGEGGHLVHLSWPSCTGGGGFWLDVRGVQLLEDKDRQLCNPLPLLGGDLLVDLLDSAGDGLLGEMADGQGGGIL